MIICRAAWGAIAFGLLEIGSAVAKIGWADPYDGRTADILGSLVFGGVCLWLASILIRGRVRA